MGKISHLLAVALAAALTLCLFAVPAAAETGSDEPMVFDVGLDMGDEAAMAETAHEATTATADVSTERTEPAVAEYDRPAPTDRVTSLSTSNGGGDSPTLRESASDTPVSRVDSWPQPRPA